MTNWVATLLALGSTFAFVGTPSEHDQSVRERRERMLAVAESYARHEWRATPANVFHGLDTEGVRVDTPDAGRVKGGFKTDGSTNLGVPYQWGGFSSLTEFDEGVRAKMYAGHDPVDTDAAASYRAVGVDCSGFVSRCWNLPFKRSTNSLPPICYELADFAELELGDVVNLAKGHVMLFERFTSEAKTEMRVHEATVPTVHAMTITVEKLRKLGYRPLRYKPLDPRWTDEAMAFTGADLELERGKGDARWTRERTLKEANAWTDASDPLRTTKRGEWVRYAAKYEHALRTPKQYELTFGCVEARESKARLAITTAIGASTEELVEDRKLRETFLGSLLALFLEVEVVEISGLELSAESGRLVVGKRTLDVTRRTVEFDARLYTKDGTPLHVRIVCYTSEPVPLHGIVEAEFGLRVGKSSTPLEIAHRFELIAARDE